MIGVKEIEEACRILRANSLKVTQKRPVIFYLYRS